MATKKISKDAKMIDALLSSVGGKTTAKKLLSLGYKKSNAQFTTASEIVGKRFCINPGSIRKWYKEKIFIKMKSKKLLWILVTLAMLAFVVDTTSAGTISGYILEPYNNDPVEYACVCGNDTCDETNSAGYYELTGVTGGPHTIIACIAMYYCNTTTGLVGDTNRNITLSLEREKANESVSMLDEKAYEMLMESWGARFHWTNETDCDEMTSQNMSYNFTLFNMAIAEPYVNIMGSLFFFFVFSMPFLMMYLRQENVLIPSINGIILGSIILGFLPAEFHLPAIAFIALSIVGILYIALKERT